MKEWTDVMNNHQTIFCDYDGVIVKNKGKFGVTNWYNSDDEPIEENVKTIKELVDAGATLVITTSRDKSLEPKISDFLNSNGITNYTILCGLPHARRVLINDYANTNPYPSAISLNLERNGSLNKLTNNL
jgi:ribonucleotide monophosphatase NagD (HAD superfamily)